MHCFYRWNTPHDWLEYKIIHAESLTKLRKLIQPFIHLLDADDIQSEHQELMDADYYFDPLN